MCSVNNCDFNPLFTQEKESKNKLENSICKKCLEKKAFILLRGKDAYCQDCFLAATTHKFRASLGKSKLVRPTDSVLVAHSGKAGSTVLLHLIQAGMQQSVHKRLVFKTTVLYIDENILYESEINKRISSLKNISHQVNDLGFSGYSTTLSQIFNPNDVHLEPLDSTIICTEHDQTLLNCFDSLSDITSKEDFLTKMRQRLIVKAVRKLNCNKVFLAEDMTNLAIKLLENISLGRAAHLSMDVGFVDSRYQDLLILRPMKDFSRKELHYYINYFKLPIIHRDNLTTKKNVSASIRKLTEKFVTELEAESNSTVSTIFRVGEKLSTNPGKKEDLEKKEICILCEALLDTNTEDKEICTIVATSFSRLLNEKGINYEGEKNTSGKRSTENCSSNCNGDCKTTIKRKVDMDNILKFFCYGCRLIVCNFKSPEHMPEFCYKKVMEQISLESMRSEIEEFLL